MRALITDRLPMWVAETFQIPRSALRDAPSRDETPPVSAMSHANVLSDRTDDSPASWANDDYAALLRERDLLIKKDWRATHGATRGPAMTDTERKRLAWLEGELWRRACEEAGR